MLVCGAKAWLRDEPKLAHADVIVVLGGESGQRVIGAAESAFGPVDLFCANAGVAVGVGMATPAEWDVAFGVNIRAHIVAADRAAG